MEVGGIEPHTRVAGQGLRPYCDHIVTVFSPSIIPPKQPENGSSSLDVGSEVTYAAAHVDHRRHDPVV
jgi:hypothetical protein